MSEIVSNLLSKNVIHSFIVQKVNSKNAFEVPLLNVTEFKYFEKEYDGTWSRVSSTL